MKMLKNNWFFNDFQNLLILKKLSSGKFYCVKSTWFNFFFTLALLSKLQEIEQKWF